tara:strand:- start:3731 stop:3904 length:174 start_codon:yes stop_codon:yes gene_type:complete
MPPKAAETSMKKFIIHGGDSMIEIKFPNKEEIFQALQSEDPTDRELWIFKQFGGGSQ